MRGVRTMAVCLLALAGGCAQLDTTPEDESGTPTGSGSQGTTRLLAEPPDGWVQVSQHMTDAMHIADFAPRGETEQDWATLVSFESFAAEDEINPIDLLITEADTDAARCSFLSHFSLSAGLENGYPTSVRMMFCGENQTTGMGEAKIVKAIWSPGRIYVVRITRRMPAFEPGGPESLSKDEVAGWSGWLRRIKVCDPSAPEHPCPG